MGIGKKIILARKKLNITQAELARKIGQKPPVVSNWENSIFNPSPKNLASLARALGVSVSYFYETDIPAFSLNDATNLPPQPPTSVGVGHRGEILFIGQPPTKEEAMRRKQECITIKDDGFSPVFNPGDVVFWDYNLKPKPGAYVLVKLHGNKYTFGKIRGKKLTDLHDNVLQGEILAAITQKTEVLY